MTFTSFDTELDLVAGTYTGTLELTILKNGMPFTDYAQLGEADFIVFDYDIEGNEHLSGRQYLDDSVTMVEPGMYVLTGTGLSFDPTVNGVVYGYIAQTPLFQHEGGTGGEIPAGSHVHLYEDVANAALAFGDSRVGVEGTYESMANVSGCAKCHGTPYLKHGYRAAEVDGLADFVACKSCHYAGRNGFLSSLQWMVDDPLSWATGAAKTADYTYEGSIMNDTHMSHAMEFPYPMSMSNCNTCHEGKLAQILDDSQFTVETCKSCHPVRGLEAWPEAVGTTLAGKYAQPHRAPPLEYLWAKSTFATHDISMNCQQCHFTGAFKPFAEMHSGYDDHIYDDTGTKYADLNTVTIDSVSMAGNLLTVNFHTNNVAVVPEVLISLYGWNTKNFIVASHTSDGSTLCLDRHGDPGGCRMEFAPGDTNALFMETDTGDPLTYSVTVDFSAYVPTAFLPRTIPVMIAAGEINKAEITITPELAVGGQDVVLRAVGETFDFVSNTTVANYFKDANATVSITKCNACHDSLASTFHDGSGRSGDGIEVCKNCHVTTKAGSHLEMASRAIDSYVHAIHSFQQFDLGAVVAANDPVFTARKDLHINHTFPNFTIRNCEACHIPGTYDVPDQSKSMFGTLSKSWDIADRNIGTIPEYVTGPASRACGGCHRADLINADLAGDLATLNAHTKAFGTLEENDDDELILYGIIDKIMSMF
jgi:OmcA/MtrC family decaheme c-type cytochrome